MITQITCTSEGASNIKRVLFFNIRNINIVCMLQALKFSLRRLR